jgi:hypothetical protein
MYREWLGVDRIVPKSDESIKKINEFIQAQMREKKIDQCGAIEASVWLERKGILRNDKSKPGRPLRVLLRKGMIKGAKIGQGGRWVISRVKTH